MFTLDEIHEIGKDLEQLYLLKTAPLAIRLINEDEIPEGAKQPTKEGIHYALCQAISYVRRTRHTMVMFAEDHWCLWPVINFRLREIDEDDKRYVGSGYFIRGREASYDHFIREYPYIDGKKAKKGMALAPLTDCTFVPDAVMIYCEPSQLRQFLMAAKYESANIAGSSFDTCDSCGAALVPVLNGEMPYNVSIPDAGEFERGLCGENEMIFTLSYDKLGDLIDAARGLNKAGFGLHQLAYDLRPDYPRPKFYDDMFKKWGLFSGGLRWEHPGER